MSWLRESTLQNSSGKGLQQNQNRPIFSKVLATQSDTKQSKLSCIYIEIKGDPFLKLSNYM